MANPDLLYEAAEFEQAAQAYREAVAHAMLGLGLCLDQLGRYDEAGAAYRSVLDSAGASEEQKKSARRNLAYGEGMRAFSAGDFTSAQANFVKALTLQPDDDAFRGDILKWLSACQQLTDADPSLFLVALRHSLEADHAPQTVLERRILDLRLAIGHVRVKPAEQLLV